MGQPLSKYILEMARRGRDRDSSRTGSPEAAKELTDLREENRRLRAEQTELRKLYDRAEADIFKLRHGSYSDENFQGDRQPAEKLIAILQSHKTLSKQDLLQEMGIDISDIEAMKILLGQLQALQTFGLVDESARGWRWVG